MRKILCYGSYVKVLHICGVNSQKQEDVHRELMASVDDLSHIGDVASQASRLFSCKMRLNRRLIEDVREADPVAIRENMERYIEEWINPSMLESAVAAIRVIIEEDEYIPENCVVDCITNITKADLRQRHDVDAVDFLAGTFIYAVLYVDNRRGIISVYGINEDFVEDAARQFRERRSLITNKSATSNYLVSLQDKQLDSSLSEPSKSFISKLSARIRPGLLEHEKVIDIQVKLGDYQGNGFNDDTLHFDMTVNGYSAKEIEIEEKRREKSKRSRRRKDKVQQILDAIKKIKTVSFDRGQTLNINGSTVGSVNMIWQVVKGDNNIVMAQGNALKSELYQMSDQDLATISENFDAILAEIQRRNKKTP